MADTDASRHRQARPGRCAGRAAAVDGSALEPERSGLAVFPERGHRVRRPRRRALVATAALLPYSVNNAWISMVLVTASWRRRGLATRLVDACLDTARKNGLTTWLDATPDGRHGLRPARLYADAAIAAVEAGGADDGRQRHHRRPLAASMRFVARDVGPWVSIAAPCSPRLRGRSGSRIVSHGAIALVRDGRTARHIGPLFADNAAARWPWSMRSYDPRPDRC